MVGIFGEIQSPFMKEGFASEYTYVHRGLPLLISNIVRMVTVVAGIWMFFNFITAGLTYLTAEGSQEKLAGAQKKIWQSILGLVIILAAFAITGVLSQLLYGDPGTILNPTIYGPGSYSVG